MNCEDVQSLLPDYYDDMLTPVTRYAVQIHLQGCEACNKELHEITVLFESIAGTDEELPSTHLKEKFGKMLDEEVRSEEIRRNRPGAKVTSIRQLSTYWKVAAAVAIFLSGVLVGQRFHAVAETGSCAQIRVLQSEVQDVKELMMFKMLKEESASDRIQAVNYVNEMPNPDNKVISALINTLNHDKNVNVRLASLYSLAKFSDVPAVSDSLVNSLSRQTEPLIQIVLINMLAAKREAKARKPIQDILNSDQTIKEVKVIAAKGLKTI
jgi:hypothetical protein